MGVFYKSLKPFVKDKKRGGGTGQPIPLPGPASPASRALIQPSHFWDSPGPFFPLAHRPG